MLDQIVLDQIVLDQIVLSLASKPTLFISVNVKAVSCSLDVSIDFTNVFVENDQLYSYVNEKLGTGI